MNSYKVIGIILLVAGALSLIYKKINYSEESTALKVGSVELKVKEDKSMDIPLWAGIGAIVVGGALLVFGGKK